MDVDERANPTPPSSFRSMYREHYGLVWGAARRFGVEDHMLDDAVQETFLVAYRRMGTFDGRSPKAWLYGITRRVASNVRRSERRTTRRKDAVLRTMQTAASRPAEAVEAWQALDRFVRDLSEREREIFVLSELEGMTGAEVARSLSLPPSTTYDAIRSLRRRFTEEVQGAPPPDALRRMAQRERPRATARSWSALVAALPGRKITETTTASSPGWWSTMSVGAKATVAGLGTAAAIALGVAVGGSEPSGPSSTKPRTSHTASASASPQAGAMTGREEATSPDELARAESPEADEPSEAPAEAPVETPAETAPASPPATARTPERPAPTAAPAAPRSLAAENALLRDAAAALSTGQPARALELADRHAEEHAHSPMIDISTALRIESLCALGKRAQARGEASVFLRRRPRSPMADRVRAACPEESTAVP